MAACKLAVLLAQSKLVKHYRAPWGKLLIIMSVAASALCLGLTAFGWRTMAAARFGEVAFWRCVLPAALVIGCALFAIRGYSVSKEALLIHRLFWATRIPLEDLQSAEVRPGAMRGSIRTFGNGGFFSFSGWYRNRALGSYRAYVTDLQRTVILRFPNRTLVVSPESPEDFVRELAGDEPSVSLPEMNKIAEGGGLSR